jgi:peptidoglycan/LPS O-acetylase OafA/YrhL
MEIRKLNMLRGIAALIVVISHYSNQTNIFSGVLGNGGGQFGVMLFFMLSGFLMSYLYLDQAVTKTNIKKYAIFRIARVVPLFLIVILISYAFQLFELKGIFYNVFNLISLSFHLLLLSGDSVLWTIAPEIHFYMLFVFLWWLRSKHLNYLIFFIISIFLILLYFNFPNPNIAVLNIPLNTNLFKSLPYFFVGVLFGQLYKNWTFPKFSSGFFIIFLLFIPVLYPKIFYFIMGYNHEMWQDIRILMAMSIIFFSVIFLVPNDNIVLSNKMGDFLGKISYSLYLLHMPILNLLETQAKQQPLSFLVIFVALSLIISYLSYLIIESPLRKFIRNS